MKIAVYSIARNEVLEVAGWEEATREADFRLLFDTGSTDGTDTEMAKFSNVSIFHGVIRPWRFDDARNAALSLIPDDIDVCVALDMDERLRGAGKPVGEGWHAAICRTWQDHTRMLRCSMNSGGVVYYSYRIHSRWGFRWKNPVHETLYWRGEGNYVETLTDDLVIDHFPSIEKPRPPHLSMLVEAVTEAPHDARMALQYGWQLVVEGQTEAGISELNRYLSLSDATGTEASFVHRLIAKHDPDQFLVHMRSAEDAFPSTSNQLVLAEYYRDKEKWQECYSACQAAIARERMRPSTTGHWGDDARIKTSWLHDVASASGWMMWDFEAAYGHAVEAYRRNPDESRRENIKRIAEHIGKGATLENLPAGAAADVTDQLTQPIRVEVHRAANTESENETSQPPETACEENSVVEFPGLGR